jgi:hypothetical protein
MVHEKALELICREKAQKPQNKPDQGRKMGG